MHTFKLIQAETRTLSIEAEPADVLGYLDDPHNLPEWAPTFASEVRLDGPDVIVGSGEPEVRLRVLTSNAAKTVDLVSAADSRRGAFLRVLPNGHGSELLFTLFFADGTPEQAVDAQMTEVEAELERIRAACRS